MSELPSALQESLVADELIRCNRCGYCMGTCPTYRAVLDERQVARGRNELVRQVTAGGMRLGADLRDPLFECLLCGACTETCFASVKTDEVMVRAREAWHEQHGQPAIQQFIFDKLLPHPQRMTRLMRLLALGKRSGLSDLARRLGVLRWINATLDGAEGLVATMPRLFLRDRLLHLGFQRHEGTAGPQWRRPRDDAAPARGPTIVYFIGCGTNFQLPGQGEAALRLLAAAGCELVVVENVCCGLPPYSYGDRAAARNLVRRNLEILSDVDFDLLTTECGSCSGFLKKWPQLLGEDPARGAAEGLASRVRDATELLAELKLPPATSSGVIVTYHDPCHLRRGQGVADQPRKLLRDAGLDLVELTEADWCCGGAGSYNLTHPDISLQILNRKMARIAESQAGAVATACPACVIQLAYGSRQRGGGQAVRHVCEFVAQAHGLWPGP